MLKQFNAFAMRGNVLDLAVAVIIGAAFGTVVKSLVDDIIMPPVGLALGQLDFSQLFTVLKSGTPPPPYNTVADAHAAGAVTLNYGAFVGTIVTFLIVAFAVFLIVRAANRVQPADAAAAPSTKDCAFCRMPIPVGATRCPQCTSQLVA
ncbi:MAG: large conductance mechanosensitive channel protein MscL [Gemmatimonadales bacterium]|nr:large conductance mechanosensitive channel protein MscL [Gemmatimonadales bacterium]